MKHLNTIITSSNKWVLCDTEINIYLLQKESEIDENFSDGVGINVIYFILKGFLKLIYLYLKQFQNKIITSEYSFEHIIAETLASHHHKNYFKYINKDGKTKHLVFNCFKNKEFTSLVRLSLKELLTQYFKNSKEMISFLQKNIPKALKKKILNYSANNIGNYSYFCALLMKLKSINPNLILFHGGAYLLSHAANVAGVRNFILSHGLITKMDENFLPLGNYYVYSSDELKYLKSINNKLEVNIYPSQQIQEKSNKLICFLNEETLATQQEIEDLKVIIKYFSEMNYEILLKPHPTSDNRIADSLSLNLEVKICTEKIDAIDLIMREKPSFVACWLSTVMSEALNANIIPICLERDESPMYDIWIYNPENAPYPYKKRSLSWKEESQTIKLLVEKEERYSKILSKLKLQN